MIANYGKIKNVVKKVWSLDPKSQKRELILYHRIEGNSLAILQ